MSLCATVPSLITICLLWCLLLETALSLIFFLPSSVSSSWDCHIRNYYLRSLVLSSRDCDIRYYDLPSLASSSWDYCILVIIYVLWCRLQETVTFVIRIYLLWHLRETVALFTFFGVVFKTATSVITIYLLWCYLRETVESLSSFEFFGVVFERLSHPLYYLSSLVSSSWDCPILDLIIIIYFLWCILLETVTSLIFIFYLLWCLLNESITSLLLFPFFGVYFRLSHFRNWRNNSKMDLWLLEWSRRTKGTCWPPWPPACLWQTPFWPPCLIQVGYTVLYIAKHFVKIYPKPCKCIEHIYLKVLSNGAGGGPKLVSIDPFL